jgi:hypothetical protein
VTIRTVDSELKVRPDVAPTRWRPIGERPRRPAMYRCASCGHVERHDSSISGICSMCPGIVELKPA